MSSESPVRERVQIVPLGFEYTRLKAPILHWKADVVVALEYADATRDIPYITELLDELAANDRITLDRRPCDLFDLYDALGAITRAIADYETDDVYVNLSAGSKITAIAGMIACMASEASPLYARPDYGPDGERIPDEPLHDEVATMFELPTTPIDRPSNLHLAFLAQIADQTNEDAQGWYQGVSKKALIGFALEEEFLFVVESETTTQKGYYRLLDRHVLDPLHERGYVTVEQVGRRKYVSVTANGENTLRAFRHFIQTEN